MIAIFMGDFFLHFSKISIMICYFIQISWITIALLLCYMCFSALQLVLPLEVNLRKENFHHYHVFLPSINLKKRKWESQVFGLPNSFDQTPGTDKQCCIFTFLIFPGWGQENCGTLTSICKALFIDSWCCKDFIKLFLKQSCEAVNKSH